ncbi:MAG: hypothetical protein SGPRY_007779 [Prymnesium sp.]
MSSSVEGAWTPEMSGGCPKFDSWHKNPQFQLFPSVQSGSYLLELRQHPHPPSLVAGMWVMLGDDLQARKRHLSASETVGKSKFKVGEQRLLELSLPRREGGLPYIVICSTYEPAQYGGFTLKLSSPDDQEARLIPLQPPPGPSARLRTSTPPRSAPLRSPPTASLARPTQKGEDRHPVPPHNPSPPPANEVSLEVEGQGLSSELQRQLSSRVQAALLQCENTGLLYDDPDFPPSPSSLSSPSSPSEWPSTVLVSSWRRPSEIAGEPKLFKSSWEAGAVGDGPLRKRWLFEALNILAGDVELCEGIFVDATHKDKGLYAIRLFHDDPSSDDDWTVVLVDDKLPCGDDGLPCFGRCVDSDVFWVSIVEKAVAKHYGSYALTEGPATSESVAQGLELLTGGRASRVPTPLTGGDADALWATLTEALESKYVIGVRCPEGSPPERRAEELGLVVGREYCLVTVAPISGNLVKLRGLHSDPEWKGKWADNDSAWTNQLRNMLSYQDVSDGSFWMSFDDFNLYFAEVNLVRMADDRWTRLTVRVVDHNFLGIALHEPSLQTSEQPSSSRLSSPLAVKSRWMDDSAGGGPEYITWRNNYQWLLMLAKPTRVIFQVTQPTGEPGKPPNHAAGLLVVRGNSDDDSRCPLHPTAPLLLYHPL